jgi:hypothetical protein
MALLERIVSSPLNVFMASTRQAAVQDAINGSGSHPVPVPRQPVWPTLQRYNDDNGAFVIYNPTAQDPEYVWDNNPQNGQFLGFAVSSSAYTLPSSTTLDINVVTFADNAHTMQIDLVNADTNAIISTPPLGVLLDDGSMNPATGTTTETLYFPYNWQNIRFYSISVTLPAGRYKIIVSYTALNYDQYPGLSNPAALAFVADISASSAVTPMTVFNQTQGTFYPTINSAVAVANNNDVLLVLPGTINQSTQVVINKPLTLRGLPGSRIVLTAPIIPFMVVGNNITLQNLTITSDMPYANEFIQVGGNNNRIINNTIFGPPQALPMSNWVVNRAVVPQANNANNLLVQGNNFNSLRTGMYLNPGTNGNITNNVVFNTKGGFIVDNASFVLQGNSWGNPPNEFDIVLLISTPCNSPLYDPTTSLSANNNGASISDQRVCP